MQTNKAKLANLRMLQFMANKLGELTKDIIFVGGSTVALFITDETIPDVRSTVDVDCIIDVVSHKEYRELEKKLREKGFKQSIYESIICRWFYDGAVLDIVPTNEKILGFANPWYKAVMRYTVEHQLEDDSTIQVISPPYFLATKLSAFNDRGKSDYLASHDFEDIINVIDGRPEIVDEVLAADNDLQQFLSTEFNNMLVSKDFHDALPGHLVYYGSQVQPRTNILIKRIKAMIGNKE